MSPFVWAGNTAPGGSKSQPPVDMQNAAPGAQFFGPKTKVRIVVPCPLRWHPPAVAWHNEPLTSFSAARRIAWPTRSEPNANAEAGITQVKNRRVQQMFPR